MKKLLFLLILLCIPLKVFGEELIPNSTSGILVEASSGKILFEKDKDLEVSVASLTKMVSQIIILEEVEKGNIKWSDIVTVSRNASSMGGSQIYLSEGEKISVEDLMKGISVASGNDATVAISEYISGSEEKFVKRMNKKVKELGLKHTHFVNCTGLDEEGHFSSAYDMSVIAKELVTKHPEILRFSSIYEDYLREDTPNKFWLVNTNKLISQYSGTDGLKTGHTDLAGYSIAATTKRNNLRLIGIVLGEKDSKIRNMETMELLDYGFNNVKLKTLKKKNSIIKSIKLDNNYVPKDLETISTRFALSNMKMVKEAKEAFEEMASAAKKENYNIIAMSCYRSYDYQVNLYNRYVKQDGKEAADTYSGRPGHSEHQTGLAVDVYNGKTNYTSFEKTKEFNWMNKHAHEYGFILRFPKDKVSETGYTYESWHYRYVGIEEAKYIKENDISFEEYYATIIKDW